MHMIRSVSLKSAPFADYLSILYHGYICDNHNNHENIDMTVTVNVTVALTLQPCHTASNIFVCDFIFHLFCSPSFFPLFILFY